MSYDPLAPSELALLSYFQSLPAEDASTPGGIADESGSEAEQDEDAETRTPPPHAHQQGSGSPDQGLLTRVKSEPEAGAVGAMGTASSAPLDLNGLGDINMSDLGLGSDAAFLNSLGLGASGAPGTSGVAASEAGGVGDVSASVFHPLDVAGRPIGDLSLLGPANLDSLAAFPGLQGPFPGQLGGFGSVPEEEDAGRPFPAWNDDAEIPDYVPAFFPPFPGMERESAETLARRRRRAREREREALAAATAAQQDRAAHPNVSRAAAALMLGGGAGGDPWADAIPYSASSLATMASEFGHSLPTPASPRSAATKRALEAMAAAEWDKENAADEGGAGGRGRRRRGEHGKRKRRRSLSPPSTAGTSLSSFASIQPLIPHEPAFLPPNQLRRSAAGYIAFALQHPELNISSDSLFGSLPYAAPLRQATLPPGFLPDFAPPLIHPFNTNLPFTVSNPVPYHPAAPTSILPAAQPNPRIPTPLSSIARELSFPLQFDTRPGLRDQLHPNIALFARLRRIGPPGPLGPKGEALNYEYIGNTALLALSAVDWPERRHNAKLPRRFGDDPEGGAGGGAGGEGGAGTGIKLKLGGNASNANQQGRQTREGSLFGGTGQGISTPWNTFGASPSATPFSTAGGTAPPPPLAQGDFDLAAFSASLATAPVTADSSAALVAGSSSSAAGAGGSSAFPPAEPQADFDYPEFLLSAGGLSSGGAVEGAGGTGAFDWATVSSAPPASADNVSATPQSAGASEPSASQPPSSAPSASAPLGP